MDKAKLLAGSSLFCDLPILELQRLAQHAALVPVRAQQVIVVQGKPGESMYCVVRGRFKVSRINVDQEKESGLAILQEGDCFGEMALLGNRPRSATVTALEAGELLVLQRNQLDDYLMQNPAVMRRLIGILSDRLATADEGVSDALFLPFPRRMAKFIRQLAAEHGVSHPDGILIDIELRRDEIATFTGSAREPVSRLLTEWRTAGLISTEMHQGKIVVHDLDRLPV